MKLRKINAVFSLVSTVLLLAHAISLAAWMLSSGAVPKAPGVIPHMLTMVFAIHAVLSIILLISTHKGSGKNKGKVYAGLNAPTIAQRISGVLLIIFTAFHIIGFSGITHIPLTVHAIIQPILFIIVFVHIAVSVSKALITLGIGNAGFIKVADIVVKVISVAVLIADVLGLYLFIW